MMFQLRLPLRAAGPLAAKPFLTGDATGAVEQVMDWTQWPSGALALVGPAGVGKSHLAARWAVCTDAWTLEADANASVPNVEIARLAEDADRKLGDRAYEEALFHALNRAACGLSGPLLLTGRTAPTQWRCGLPDLRSRLNALPVAVLGEPDDALLRALLVGFFRERSIKPGEDLLDYLVRRMERSAAGAAAIVEALDSACRQGARLGRPLARDLLHDSDETDDLFAEDGPQG